jgi:hypothetical protein
MDESVKVGIGTPQGFDLFDGMDDRRVVFASEALSDIG